MRTADTCATLIAPACGRQMSFAPQRRRTLHSLAKRSRPVRPPPKGARLPTRSGERQRSRLLGMCRSPAPPTFRRRLTAAAVVDGSYESRRGQQVLDTRTSTKATAVLVIAFACVFGAPAVA